MNFNCYKIYTLIRINTMGNNLYKNGYVQVFIYGITRT